MIPVSRPLITIEDIEKVKESLEAGFVSGETEVVEEFERSWANVCNRKFGIAVANGTVALDLAIEALDLKPGDEVILPSFTIVSCMNAILRLGLVPVFVDSNAIDWNMNCSDIESKITYKTRAIVVVHIYGLCTDMDTILQLSKKYQLHVIEDAAEAHGLKYKGHVCGSFGVLSTFSFYANKNITTGEGGMVLTNDEKIAEKIRNLRNLNFRKHYRFISDALGYNYRLTSMQAALGISQITRLQLIISQRKKIAHQYNHFLKNLDFIQLPTQQNDFSENNYWVYGVVLKNEFEGKAIQAMEFLKKQGIGTRPFFQGLHKQPVLKNYPSVKKTSLPVTENLSKSGFYIPNSLDITENEQKIVAQQLIKLASVAL